MVVVLSLVVVRPVEKPQRGPGNHYRGALSQPHSICAEIKMQEETWGRVFPHHPTRGLEAPPAGSGAPKIDFIHILGQKEAIWNIFFNIFEQWRAPKMSWGPGKFSPLFPPVDGPGSSSSSTITVDNSQYSVDNVSAVTDCSPMSKVLIAEQSDAVILKNVDTADKHGLTACQE